jgi:hypothetical protein
MTLAWPCNRLLLALSSRNLQRLLPELEHIRCGEIARLTPILQASE